MSVYEHCKHFDGRNWCGAGASGLCDAGIRYRDVRLPKELCRPLQVMPCHAWARGVDYADTCPRREWPTSEEVAAEEAEMKRVLAAVLAGLCPTCGAKLQRHTRQSGGYTEHCPACRDVSVRACSRGDIREGEP